MNKSSLPRRTENFRQKLEKLGKFTYVSDYRGYKYPVVVRHNACGSTMTVLAESMLNVKKADICKGCTSTIRYNTLKEKEVKIREHYNNIVVLDVDKTTANKTVYVVKCLTCGKIYKVQYSVFKNKTFSCCMDEKGSLYDRHRDSQAKTIYKKMRPNYLFGEDLINAIDEHISNISYIKNNTVDKEKFIIDIYNAILDHYITKKIGVCVHCQELKRGRDWGAGEELFKSGICYSCVQKVVECSTCSKTKKQKNFEYDYKTNTFSEKCNRCKKKEQELEQK